MLKLFLFISFFVFTPNVIFAQVDSPPYQPPGNETKPPTDTFSFDIGLNKYNGDGFLYFNPKFNMDFDNWGFSLQIPLNFLAYDKDPKYPKSSLGMLRPGDYNTREDYLKLINFVWFGKYGQYKPGKITTSIYVGKMFNGYIGHGTIINRYVNNQRIDYYKVGIMADINTDYGGAQVFTNSISDREVNAGRGYIRPYGAVMGIVNLIRGKSSASALVLPGNVLDEAGRKSVLEEAGENDKETRTIIEEDPKTGELTKTEKEVPKKSESLKEPDSGHPMDTIWNRFAIGATAAYDGKAPYELDFDTTGNLKYTNDDQPQVKTTKRVYIQGYDAEFKFLSLDWLELTAYYDFNKFRDIPNAYGRHYGAIFKLGNRKINLTVRPEYRKMSSSYMPMYFDSFYEIERFQSSLEADFPTTKYQYLRNLRPDDPEIRGYYHTAILNIYSIGFELNYEDYEGKDNSRIFVGAYIPILNLVRISGFYIKKGFDRSAEAFKVDERSQGVGEIAFTLGPIMLKLQNRRRWIYNQNENRYDARDEQYVLFSGG
ncbi:MAG: hypothetical protein KDK36_07520, partial [Leptospiraceae bacterium]|nr:hypothetical protein [Leptospiraceae bacterium]